MNVYFCLKLFRDIDEEELERLVSFFVSFIFIYSVFLPNCSVKVKKLQNMIFTSFMNFILILFLICPGHRLESFVVEKSITDK